MTAEADYIDTLFLKQEEAGKIEFKYDGNTLQITMNPTETTYHDEERLYAKIKLLKSRYPSVGVTLGHAGDRDTFGPMGRFGTGVPYVTIPRGY